MWTHRQILYSHLEKIINEGHPFKIQDFPLQCIIKIKEPSNQHLWPPSYVFCLNIPQTDSQLQDSNSSNSSNMSEVSGMLAAPDCQSFDISSVCAGKECASLPGYCIHCDFNESCVYGESSLTANCWPKENVNCSVLLPNGSVSWTVDQHQVYFFPFNL